MTFVVSKSQLFINKDEQSSSPAGRWSGTECIIYWLVVVMPSWTTSSNILFVTERAIFSQKNIIVFDLVLCGNKDSQNNRSENHLLLLTNADDVSIRIPFIATFFYFF